MPPDLHFKKRKNRNYKTAKKILQYSMVGCVAVRVLKLRFYGDHVRMIFVQLPPSSRRIVAFIDKTPYGNYLYLVASNKQKISWKKSKSYKNTWKMDIWI